MREVAAGLGEDCVVAVREAFDEGVGVRGVGGLLYFFVGGALSAVADV